jgi:hypothetical protein
MLEKVNEDEEQQLSHKNIADLVNHSCDDD